MGRKVHPTIHRTPVTYGWHSSWFAKKNDYATVLGQDLAIREYLLYKGKDAQIDAVQVERGPKRVTVNVLAAKPGFLIGRSGSELDKIRKHIECKILKMKQKVTLNIKELRNPALSASVIAQSIANDLERRIPFRRLMKQSIERVMTAGGKGVKIAVAGRLNGADIARTEKLSKGKVPLITLRSDVDYATARANTIYGVIGIKVWVYKGELFSRKDRFAETEIMSKEAKKSARPRGRKRSPRK